MGFYDFLENLNNRHTFGYDPLANPSGASSGPELDPSGAVRGTNIQRVPLSPLRRTEGQAEDFLDFQGEATDIGLGFETPYENPLNQRILSQLSPTGPFAQQGLGNIRSQSAGNLRSAESKIGASLGARGISGSPEAALMSQATSENLKTRLGAETGFLGGLQGLQAQFAGGLAGANTGLQQAQIGMLGGQEYPMIDFQSLDESQFGMDFLTRSEADFNQTRDNTSGPFGGTAWEGNWFDQLVGGQIPAAIWPFFQSIF
jgi:hypothetical protein